MTDMELIKMVIDKLNNIEVPVKYYNSIIAPVKQSANLLQMLYDALLNNQAKAQTETSEEPQIEVFAVKKEEELENETVEQSV